MDEKQATPHGATPEASAEPPRKGGVRHLAGLLPRLTKAALGKRGFAEGGIVADWPDIVGPELAAVSLPERLAFPQGARRDGILHVRVAGSLALELQHLEPVVIERINGYFGYRAIAELRILQAPLARPATPRTAPAAPPPPIEAPELATIADERLRTALARLKSGLMARAPAA